MLGATAHPATGTPQGASDMFVIVGLRNRTRTVDRGRFRCPNEGGDRTYHHERSRRWFTLFLLPLIPLGSAAEWVHCDGCGVRYGTDVVRRHPAGR